MSYIAHKEGERIQTLQEHLSGTAELAKIFAEKFGKGEWGYCAGMLHDIGKYSEEFQRKIWHNLNDPVDHSTAGAKVCGELGGLYELLTYCIAGHHAGLSDYDNGNTAVSSSLCGRLKKKIYDYQAYKLEVTIPALTTEPFEIREDRNMDFAPSVFVRMIYSCLVDADYLDTERFMKAGSTGRNSGESMEILLKKLEKHISKWLKNTDINTINGRRTEILKHCMKKGKEQGRGLFRLTVPTGGGKTVASLAFALKHAVEHQMDRVIYVIPYTSIIEQNAKVFREILGDENVLENHCNVEYKDTEELNPMQLASENWDKPVVVTTNVQFFESLFGNKSSKCRKLHNITNSVVILDEAQMLPLDYLKPCTAILQELVDNYKTSIVLCTATQPALDHFFAFNEKIVELCPKVEEQFQFFERVTYEKLGNVSEDFLVTMLETEQSALCILNTKKSAQELYQKIKGDGVYHLSTSMYPKHRKRVLEEIEKRLDSSEKCLLISTSLVEAGVNLDFAHVYRQMSGVDSMIQAAGRCNREGENEKSESKVFLFELEEAKTARNQRSQIECARSVLCDHENVAGLECITDYFERLYHNRRTSLDRKNILAEFRWQECNFSTASKHFRLIDERNKIILIAKESEAKALLDEIREKGYSRERMRKVGQYCVQLPYHENQNGNTFFQIMFDAGMIREVSADMEDFYILVDDEQYSEEYGLNLLIETGMALMM